MGYPKTGTEPPPGDCLETNALPAAWREFIRFCKEMKFGEIERLSIQDGVPVMAEMTKQKVRFKREP